MNTWVNISLRSLSEKIKLGEISSVELVEMYLRRIDIYQPKLNCMTACRGEKALEEAYILDQERQKGKLRSPLHGIPFTAKDNFDVAGMATTLGASSLLENVASQDATVIARLRQAGAVLLGKTNVPLFLMLGETDNDPFGRTLNPYHPDFISGGSGGGEAAAVAAGLSAFGLGNDMGGSILTPSHCCGLVGYRPTVGSLSTAGIQSFFKSDRFSTGPSARCTTAGPLTRRVEDLILITEVVAGSDGIDPHVVPHSRPLTISPHCSNMRVAYALDHLTGPQLDHEVRTAIQRAVESLTSDVHAIRKIDPPGVENAFQRQLRIFFGGGVEKLKEVLSCVEPKEVHPLVWDSLEIYSQAKMDTADYQNCIHEWDLYRGAMFACLRDFDVLVVPVLPCPAVPHGETVKRLPMYGYTWAYTSLGWPAVTLRVGTSCLGLPINALVVAKPWEDSKALTIAARLESLLGGWLPAPDFS